MRKESKKFLYKLMETHSPSGFEQEAQKVIRAEMKKYADEVRADVHGNVIGVKNPNAEFKVMLAGHCDEIGLMITYIDDKGFLYFQPIGGVDPLIMPGQRVVARGPKGPVQGVIGRKPIHLTEQQERGKPMKMEQMWVDIGAKDKKDAMNAVEVGNPLTIDAPVMEMRNNLLVSRGLDDKCGAFVVAEALRLVSDRELEIGVYAVATVQEELGLRGAVTSAYGVAPQAGIAVDVGFASDCPDVDKKKVGDTALGKGPILHRGANINPKLEDLIEKAAKRKKISFQMSAEPRATGTDANAMQLSRGGVATALISIPNRYMHSPVEVVSIDDLDNASKLIAGALEDMKPGMSFIP